MLRARLSSYNAKLSFLFISLDDEFLVVASHGASQLRRRLLSNLYERPTRALDLFSDSRLPSDHQHGKHKGDDVKKAFYCALVNWALNVS